MFFHIMSLRMFFRNVRFRVFIILRYLVYTIIFIAETHFPFSGQMSIWTMLIQNLYTTIFPWYDTNAFHLFFLLFCIHIVSCWNKLHHNFVTATLRNKVNAMPRSSTLFFSRFHCLITNLFCEPCCYNFLSATKM